ncbi:MAG: stealth conserved region 3 domain-containing protein [Polyangiaceae bacterium]
MTRASWRTFAREVTREIAATIDVFLASRKLGRSPSFWRPGWSRRPTFGAVSDVRLKGPVDAIVTWVDSTDRRWAAARDAEAARVGRDRDGRESWREHHDGGMLRYALRGLARHAPFVRNVHLVTEGHVPAWLARDAEGLRVVEHGSIFRDGTHLPTFNSLAIESHLADIEGLSESFLYVNDDVCLLEDTVAGDFFDGDGRPRVFLDHTPFRKFERRPADPFVAMLERTARLLSERVPGRDRPEFTHNHGVSAHAREVHRRLWATFGDELERTSASRFRSADDFALVSVAAPHASLAWGFGVPGRIPTALVELHGDAAVDDETLALVAKYSPTVVCINSATDEASWARARAWLDVRLPIPSRFERDVVD